MTLRQNIAKINFVPFSGWVIALSLVVYVLSRCICAMQSIRLKSKCYCQIKREMKKRKRKNGTFTHTQNACWSFKMELSMAEKKVDDRRQGAHSSCSNIKRFDHYDNCIRLTPWLYSLEHFAVDHCAYAMQCLGHGRSNVSPIQTILRCAPLGLNHRRLSIRENISQLEATMCSGTWNQLQTKCEREWEKNREIERESDSQSRVFLRK